MTIAPPPTNVQNRTLYICDNLPVLRGINSESVDLIATDPPFNTKRSYNAPLGSRSAKQKFDDRWKWDDITDDWYDVLSSDYPSIKELIEAAVVIEGGTVDKDTGAIDTGRTQNSIAAFLAWMAPRLIEMRRILKPTGSIYLHCDPKANSYLRLLLDAIFGRKLFQNEIVWHYAKGHGPSKRFRGKHDTILFYSPKTKGTFNIQKYKHLESQLYRFNKVDESGRRYRINHVRNNEGEYKRFYLDDGVPVDDVWSFIREPEFDQIPHNAKERTGWSTQKPLALYERIIKASSNEGDLVLDPFAGCATTCVAAERLGRKWIGIDIDPVAETITQDRLWNAAGLDQHIDYSYVDAKKRPPKRTDIPKLDKAVVRETLWRNQNFGCGNLACTSYQSREGLRKEDITIDHRIPRVRGGSDDMENFIGLCHNCNSRKGGHTSFAKFVEDYLIDKAKAEAKEMLASQKK